jgi:L-arabinokinase
VSWLRATCTDLVVSDIVPLACAAAAAAGIPAVAVTNFSWGGLFGGGGLGFVCFGVF